MARQSTDVSELRADMLAEQACITGYAVIVAVAYQETKLAMFEFSGRTSTGTSGILRIAVPLGLAEEIRDCLSRLLEAKPDPERN